MPGKACWSRRALAHVVEVLVGVVMNRTDVVPVVSEVSHIGLVEILVMRFHDDVGNRLKAVVIYGEVALV